jgi:hypothetical protein
LLWEVRGDLEIEWTLCGPLIALSGLLWMVAEYYRQKR